MDDESHAGESSRHVAKQDAKSQEHNADSLKGEALPAELGTWTSTSAEAEKSDVFPLVEASSISMSAGADPWADPSPVAAMASAISGSKRPARDNPWASNTFDLGVGGSAFPSAETVASGLREESQTQAHLEDRWGELHLPRLGNTLARYWSIKPGLLQLNSGSYGTCPKPVCDAYKALQDRQEENIDFFRQVHLAEMLSVTRGKVAKILNCETDNVVLIANATLGTNAVLRDLVYKDKDAILYFSTTYGAVVNNIDYLIDTEKIRGNQLHKVRVDLNVPWTVQSILDALRLAIQEATTQGKRIVIGVIDTVVSRPGVRLPWEQMVQILKEHQILSLVDGAHGIGHIPIDLTSADPDFFVSNCHKWLYAHRGCAVFYVAPRNLHLQRASLPTGWSYQSNPTRDNNTWAVQWSSPGTLDASPFLSIDAALDFRQMLGGEERITSYCHYLAQKGGMAAAQILDTCILESPDAELTCCMVNVQVPIIKSKIGSDIDAWMAAANNWFFTTLLQEYKTLLVVFAWQGRIWARFSAQVFLEVADFEYGARALLELAHRVNQGNAPDFLAK